MNQIPESRTLARLIDEQAERYGYLEAVVGGGQRLTYSELRQQVRTVSGRLYEYGARPGDKIGILMGNRPEWIVGALAITRLGATVVALNTWVTRNELGYLLEHSDTAFVIACATFLKADYAAMLRELGVFDGAFPRLKGVFGVGETMPEGWNSLFHNADGVACGASALIPPIPIQPSDVAFLVYTSGSTSKPKGVQLEHRGLIENVWCIGERQHVTEGDRLWLAVSLFWGLGSVNAMMNLLTHGGCIVLQEWFDAGRALELIERERCTLYYGTPNMAQAMYEHPDRRLRDLSSLRGGATIGAPEQIRRVVDLGAKEVCNIYGLTECYGNSHVTDAADTLEHRMSCVGKPLPNVEQRIIGDNGVEVPHGHVGEIRLKGYITPGYYKEPDLTRRSFDENGFFRTGDLGMIDEAGNLYLRGRIKEMIKTNGMNVSPAEVEAELLRCPGVHIAHVVGVPDTHRDELLAAVLVIDVNARLSTEEILAHCRKNLAGYKVPRLIKIIAESELPLTKTGKIQKNQIASTFFSPASD